MYHPNLTMKRLFADMSFDWDTVLQDTDKFVDSLMSYNILYFDNTEPDVRVIEVANDVEVNMVIQNTFSGEVFQTIVNNNDKETKDQCGYFRVFMENFGGTSTINFKLRTFFDRIGISAMNARCTKAVAMGLHALHMLNSPMLIPNSFCTTTIEPIEMWLGKELDMACLQTCGDKVVNGATLCEIAGMDLPVFLPIEVQQRIIQFCRNPTAQLIVDEIEFQCLRWDMFVTPLFEQREPRIPPSIASLYRAATAQETIENAISYFLVPAANQD